MAALPRTRLCLGDVLAERSFALELLTGDPQASEREVRGAHPVEVEAPARWLARDWVMLTTGVRLRGSTRAQRALIPSLESAGVAALGFGVGLGFKRVPPALLEAAEALSFPVFSVPYPTPFREIVHFVERSLTRGEEHVFRRLTALQRYLVDALGAPDPERATVERLAGFLDVGVLVVGEAGQPELVAGQPPPGELPLDGRLLGLDFGGWHAAAAPIGASARRLVVAAPPGGCPPKLLRAAAEATAPLLAAVARVGEVVRDQEQAVKAALLEEALQSPGARDPLPLGARAAAFGVDFSSPARLAVLRGAGLDLARARAELVAALERARVPHLVQRRADSLTALVQGDDEELLDALAAAAPAGAALGVGRPVSAFADAHHSLRDAELAVARRGAKGITRFEDFDLGTFMISEIPPERLGPKAEEILSVLRANPPLHEALSAYFAHDLDVPATAAALHMHRNSLRYRLARVEQLLGRSLKQPATIAAVHLALAADAARLPPLAGDP